MKFFTFLRLQMSEADGSPSNNRVMLFLLLSTVAGIMIGASISPNLVISVVVPDIPESFSSLIKWVAGILVTGGAAGKMATAYTDSKSGTASKTETTTTTETKG